MSVTEATLKPVNFLVNFWDIVTDPVTALARVSFVQPRSWWFPALLSFLTPLLYLALTIDMHVAQARKQMALALSQIPQDQIEAARPMMEKMTQPGVLFGTAAGSLVAGLLIAWGLSMLILYFSIALLGTPVKASGLWAALLWTWIPFALRPLVQLAWSLHSGALITYTGLTYFIASGNPINDQRNPLFVAASQIDLFALWHLILIYILLRVVGKLGRGGAVALTILYALILLGVHVLPVAASRLTGMG